MKMASNWSLCGVCDSLQQSNAAFVWCPDCDDCVKKHRVSKASKNHQTIPIDQYDRLPVEILKTTQTCAKHNDKFQTYCQLHDCPCCHRCVIESHNSCKDLKAIDDIVHDVKLSNAFIELEEALNRIRENFSKLITSKELNITLLHNEKTMIEKEIRDTRKRINNHLDNLQEKLINELIVLEQKERKVISDLVTKLKKREEAVVELQDNLSNIKKHASNLQVFFAMKGLDENIRSEEDYLKELWSGDTTEDTDIKLILNKIIQDFETEVKMFGQVKAHSSSNSLILERKKDMQAQIKCQSVDKVSLSQVGAFNINDRVMSSVFLLEGRIAFACKVQKTWEDPFYSVLKVFKYNGTTDFSFSLEPYLINDITFLPSTNSLAATGGTLTEQYTCIIDLGQRKITQTLRIDRPSKGITYRSGHLLYLIGNTGIQTQNMLNNSIQCVLNQQILGNPFIVRFGDNLYYTSNNGINLLGRVYKTLLKERRKSHGAVSCCDIHGNLKWVFQDDSVLDRPNTITVDNDGFIYTVDMSLDKVVVIQPGGTGYKILLSSKDGLRGPVGIDYDLATNQLLVANEYGKVLIYKVNKTKELMHCNVN